MKKQTLGMMIATLRKEHGLTQLELAEKLGVTDKAVSKWERDLSCPDVNILPKLASVLGVTVDALVQAKTETADASERKEVSGLVELILKAIALAMGVAVTALSALDELDAGSGLGMLGIGLSCLAVSALGVRGRGSK